ncbi:MAG: HPr kinase/phosphatase C-terminal domain-containing protein [Pseudomonadota bacterium]|nr:HPr kinase/phosphatase C-terminal domain-containing protein [Pseudomonadota bacterium]
MLLKRLHSTAVVLDDNGVLIIGESGSGKSDLALRLIDGGATLISDDITICKKKNDKVYLSSPIETKGLLEVREVGIITVPFVNGIKLKMVVRLTEKNLNRNPNKNFTRVLGVRVPLLLINGKSPSAVVKVKVKLNDIREKK